MAQKISVKNSNKTNISKNLEYVEISAYMYGEKYNVSFDV